MVVLPLDQLALLSRWITSAGHQVHGYLRGNEVIKNAARESFDIFDFALSTDEMARIDGLARPDGRLGDWIDPAFKWDRD